MRTHNRAHYAHIMYPRLMGPRVEVEVEEPGRFFASGNYMQEPSHPSRRGPVCRWSLVHRVRQVHHAVKLVQLGRFDDGVDCHHSLTRVQSASVDERIDGDHDTGAQFDILRVIPFAPCFGGECQQNIFRDSVRHVPTS